jgi:hypothetical protein
MMADRSLAGDHLLASHVRNILFVLADPFDQFFIREKIEAGKVDHPRLGICLRVVDGDLEADMPEVHAPEAFGHVQRFVLGCPASSSQPRSLN